MTPLQFEAMHRDEWAELSALLESSRTRQRATTSVTSHVSPQVDRMAALYRRACEHLALARARAYPAFIVTPLEQLTSDAHQAIYRQRNYGLEPLVRLFAFDFPRAVRRDAAYVWLSAMTFALPMLILGVIVWATPELMLSIVSPETAAGFEEMYSPSADRPGRMRTADTDWVMFGYYIRNNITVAFQCFAAGLFAGIGSLFFLAYNGALGGAVAGYLTARGLSSTFFSFVATHASFELTAIVLAGAAGLKIGHSLLAPGRRSRAAALVIATEESAVVLYGITALLVIAAVFEAFWSSASWLNPGVKYGVAAICWMAVVGYLVLQGRRAG